MKAWKYFAIPLFVLLYLVPLNGRLLWQPDETRYAEISREMLQRGDWVVPHMLDLRYFEKPVAGYWINNVSQMIFGHNNFAVRFGSVFCTALSALLVFWLAMLLWNNRRTALLASLIYFTSLLVYAIGTYSVLDPMITLWMSAAMVSFCLTLKARSAAGRAGAYALLGLACGAGFMTKGFLALAVPVISVLPVVIHQKRIRDLLLFGPVAILTAALLSAPWAWAIYQREPDFWNYFFWVEHIQRFAEKNAQHKAPFWFYIPILIGGALPWLALLPGALRKGWRDVRGRPELFFLMSWLLMPFLFFSIAKGKLPTYILPCFAPLSLLMAAYMTELPASVRMKVARVNGWINLIFGFTLAVAVLVLASGVGKHPVYEAGETATIVAGVLVFVGWGVFGALSLRRPQRWTLAALCPLVVALLIGSAIPRQIVYSKNPQLFIREYAPLLQESRYVLSDSVGLAAGLGWELKRSDIILYQRSGELEYGLSYPDAAGKRIEENAFSEWLVNARRQGNVSLIVHLAREEDVNDMPVPKPDTIKLDHRYAVLFYKKSE